VPAIVELRRRADEYREIELAKAKARLAKGDDPAAVLEALANAVRILFPEAEEAARPAKEA
jgi:glutamyl-tRNA reductase